MTTVRLHCFDGPNAPLTFEGPVISLGRHKTNDVVLADDDVASRFHCVVEQHSKGPIVRDLGSRNGTKINGRRVGRSVLSSGDELRVGRHRFEVVVIGASPPEDAGDAGDARQGPTGDDAGAGDDDIENAFAKGLGGDDIDDDRAFRPPSEAAELDKADQLAGLLDMGDDTPPPAVLTEHARAAAAAAADDDEVGIDADDLADLPLAPERAESNGDAKRSRSAPLRVRNERGKRSTAATPAWADQLRATIKELDAKHTTGASVAIFNADGAKSSALDGTGAGAVATRMLLLLAARARATDLHVEPKRDHVSARIRIDGVMVHITELPQKVGDAVLALIKTACQFPEGARDEVLDGHFSSDVAGARVDYRASFTPTVHGRKLVVRVLDPRGAPQSLNELLMPLDVQQRIERLCESDSGMLLAAGPTGSGKTTTLYNCLRFIDRDARNVVTIEDPVEYAIDGTTQIPVSAKQRFGALLRSVLRQDPDVILVGEIRDAETARTAAEAAMTGHIVFTTVHAKDSFSAIFRLLDLGVDNPLVANSLEIVVAQRLVKSLCPDCKRAVQVTPGQSSRIGRFLRGAEQTYVATGCVKCLRTGYKGRRGLYEMLEVNDDLRDCILQNPGINDMKRIVGQSNFRTLQQAGWELAAKGLTSLDEIDRVATTG